MTARQYLFLFTIASPQAFIEQARKTHDLYAGSRIISDLTDAAMKEVILQDSGNTIVFPKTASKSKPNRLLAKVCTDDIHGFGNAVENAARRQWIQLAAEAFKAGGVSQDLQIIDETLISLLPLQSCKEAIEQISSIAARQIAEFPDIYWAAVACSAGDDYATKHDELGHYLGGVKNVRKFCQLDESTGSRKCLLDGERTAIFYKESVDDKGKSRTPNFLSGESKMMRDYLNPGEALSAVSLVKRLYKKNSIPFFPATAQIALMHLINENWEKVYKQCFDGNEVDYQLFYEENLSEKNLKNQGIKINARYDLDAVANAIRGITNEKRTRYYAILLFDGDNFGKLWSGETLNNNNKVDLEAFQADLATRLHEFAEASTSYLDKGKGRTVYTGGDDFLGFVNLTYLFEVMGQLRKSFDELVAQPLGCYLEEGEKISFTAGVTVAHYKAPLGEVLRKARATEKRAKEIPGKDAFGVAVMKHSGEIHEGYVCFNPVYATEDRQEEQAESLALLRRIVEELKSEHGFSNTFIKSFRREMCNMMQKDGQVLLFRDPAIRTELYRLLDRSSKTRGSEKNVAVKDFLNVVDLLRQVSGSILDYTRNFLSLLDICDFIKRETSKD